MVKDSGKRGMKARANFYKKLKNRNLTEEEQSKVLRERATRLAEKEGWNDTWLKDAKDRRNIKSHKSRVVHGGHGK